MISGVRAKIKFTLQRSCINASLKRSDRREAELKCSKREVKPHFAANKALPKNNLEIAAYLCISPRQSPTRMSTDPDSDDERVDQMVASEKVRESLSRFVCKIESFQLRHWYCDVGQSDGFAETFRSDDAAEVE